MEIIGRGICTHLGLEVLSTRIRFQNHMLSPSVEDMFIPNDPNGMILFRDTQEIDHLIWMLEELKRASDRSFGTWERKL